MKDRNFFNLVLQAFEECQAKKFDGLVYKAEGLSTLEALLELVHTNKNLFSVVKNHQRQVVGFVIMNAHKEVLFCYVLPTYKNKGIMKRMFERLSAYCDGLEIQPANSYENLSTMIFAEQEIS